MSSPFPRLWALLLPAFILASAHGASEPEEPYRSTGESRKAAAPEFRNAGPIDEIAVPTIE